MQAVFARTVVFGMAVLSVFVQIGVWGATKIRSEGALFQSWQPYFGWRYGVAFAAVQIGICYWLAIDRGIVWLARTWTIGGGLLVLVWFLAGRTGPLGIDNSVALISGLGALMLALALYDGRLIPGTARSR
jgi:hypothetical protein